MNASDDSVPIEEMVEKINAIGASTLSRNYYEFFKEAWVEVLEPGTPLDDNWHIKIICDRLQEEVERIAARKTKTKDLVVNVPPRSAKSHLVTICLCPWAWTRFPHLRFINTSYSAELATTHCMESRRLIESDWYQDMWGDVFELTSDQNQKKFFENSCRGVRRACPSRSITGTGADLIVWDDPQSPEMTKSDLERETVKRVYSQTGYSRLNDQRIGLRVIVQQRLGDDDLTAFVLQNAKDSYDHYCFPAEESEAISPKACKKFYREGLFFPKRFGWTHLAAAKLPTALGAYGYALQYLQRAAPPEGGIFKRTWWRFWVPKGSNLLPPAFKDKDGNLRTARMVELPEQMERVIDSWDTAVEGGVNNDFYSGQKWGKIGANKFTLNHFHKRYDYPTAKKMVAELYNSDPNTTTLLIEKSSNGPAIKADLSEIIPGMLTIPTGKLSKEDRVRMSDTVPYSAQVEAGNIYLPHPAIAEWVDGFIEEHASFPKVAHDDQVDAASQAVNFLSTTKYIWPYYNPFLAEHHRTFSYNWPAGGYYHYIGVYVSDTLVVSIVTAAWDLATKKLYIYGALSGNQISLRKIAFNLTAGVKVGTRKIHGAYANKEAFGSTKSVVGVLNKNLVDASKKIGSKSVISITEPIGYDRLGAMSLANIWFSQNEVVIHDVCREASRQVAGWHMDKDHPAEGFGMCEALMLIISEVHRSVRSVQKPMPIDGYKRVVQRQRPSDRISKENGGWQGQ